MKSRSRTSLFYTIKFTLKCLICDRTIMGYLAFIVFVLGLSQVVSIGDVFGPLTGEVLFICLLLSFFFNRVSEHSQAMSDELDEILKAAMKEVSEGEKNSRIVLHGNLYSVQRNDDLVENSTVNDRTMVLLSNRSIALDRISRRCIDLRRIVLGYVSICAFLRVNDLASGLGHLVR